MKPTVILTRGLEDSTRLANRLAAAHFNSIVQPLLDIRPLTPPELAAIPVLSPEDVAVFVSANAVRFGLPLLASSGLSGCTCLAVGTRTASLLAEADLHPLVPQRQDSEGLLAMAPLEDIAGRTVLLVKGAAGRELLAESLSKRGAEVIEFSCYRRYYLPLSDADIRREIAPSAPLVWVAGSGEMVEHLADQIAHGPFPELQAQRLIVPSVRVALQASRCGWSDVLTAADASDEAVMAILQEHYT